MSVVPVSPDDPASVRILLVEDDEDLAALLEGIFAANPDYASTVDHVVTLSDALGRLAAGDYDAVMLDLGLPDSDGLRTARQVLEVAPTPIAVVVVTAKRDAGLAAHALELGVQDYVVKEDVTPQLVTRVVSYGVARARLQHELERARRGEERERELRRIERLAAEAGTTSVSASMLGSGSVAERLKERYEDEFVAEYARILRTALEEQAYRTSRTVDEDLRSLARVLGFVGAGPRDVIELHTLCMRRLVDSVPVQQASAVVEEGRVLVLLLMGRLVSHYREQSIVGARGPAASATASPTGKEPS